jgi:hypothetical protein
VAGAALPLKLSVTCEDRQAVNLQITSIGDAQRRLHIAVLPARDVAGRVQITTLVATAATPAGSIAWMQIRSDVAVAPNCATCVNGLGTFQRQRGHHCAGCGSCCARTVSESCLSIFLNTFDYCRWRLVRTKFFGVFHKCFVGALVFVNLTSLLH